MSANQPPDYNPQQVPGSSPEGQQPPSATPSGSQFGPAPAPQGGQPQGVPPQFGSDGQPLQGPPQHGQPLPPTAPQYGPDGQPVPPASGYPPAGGFVPPGAVAPKKQQSLLVRIAIGIGVALLIALGFYFFRTTLGTFGAMKAGDCVQQTGEDSVKVVACDSPEAAYEILGIVEKQSKLSGQLGVCRTWPDTTSVYWEGRTTTSGTVYCLKRL